MFSPFANGKILVPNYFYQQNEKVDKKTEEEEEECCDVRQE